ncbi:NAD-dependent epimerase/dehydratase family protein [Nitrosopumilus adriaticus]|uniref:NAD-dependent epimerase/dehydratase family protein n=1 Tax=Nitrosopumilus adriaticus TaxID=1580092 RepID=UPI00352DD955
MSNDLGKIMITGGAGFIGSHLTEELIKENKDVIVLDNLSTGNKSNLDFEHHKENMRLITEDLKNSNQVFEQIKDIDTIFHLAADPEVRTGFTDPISAYEQNIQNTFLLLENIRKNDTKRLVFASSSVVYGEPEIIPTPETFGPLLPISIYGGSKLACEGLISSYCNNYGINGTIVRFANVVGSRAKHGVIWDFIKKLKTNKTQLSVLGNGKQTKSYIHVKDCVDGLLFSLKNTKKNVEVFNLGNRDMVNVLDIASIVCKTMNLENVNIVTEGGTDDGRGWIGDVKEMNLDISKISNLGWNPHENSKDSVEMAAIELYSESI